MKHNIITLSLLGCCAMAAAQNTEVQYLSGRDASATVEWKFFCSAGQNSGKWRKIAVPSCWEQQGFGEYTYGRWYKKPGGKPSTETGRYRHEFRVPAAWQGKKVEIVFDGVMTDATVSVNGKTAGPTHRGAFTRFAYDISRLIDYGGKNTLEVTVKKQSDDSSVNNAERAPTGGSSAASTARSTCARCPRRTLPTPALTQKQTGRSRSTSPQRASPTATSWPPR